MVDLLLFDLDGTLLDPRREILEENLAAIREVQARGIRVGLATGRSRLSAAPYMRKISANGPCILFNGARVWDPTASRFAHELNLPIAEALQVLSLVPDYDDLHVNLYLDDRILVSRSTERSRISEIKDGVPHTVVGPLAEWLGREGRDPIKLMLISEPAVVDAIAVRLRALGLASSLVRSEPEYLEVMRVGVTKGGALPTIEGSFGIKTARIAAFGDNLNDLELVRDAGIGVAMGNADERLKQLARHVIGPHDRPSIAEFIRAHLR